MEQRLIEIILPEGKGDDIRELLHERDLIRFWRDSVEGNRARIRLLLKQSEVESVLDILEPYLEQLPDASALLLIVEASIPRENGNKTEPETDGNDDTVPQKSSNRLSRHELYNDITSNADISSTYLLMVVLSAIVAAIGLARDDTAILIGAMVMAPLLVPNVGLALASTLGDVELAKKTLLTALTGVGLALSIGVIIGYIAPVDPENTALAARTNLTWSDLVLALASGTAGVLAFTSGGHLSLIGVMVAVALMPPLVTAGLYLGSGYPALGLGALELACANVICVNLSGIITFSLQGIRPSTWWESSLAGKSKHLALMFWGPLLAIMVLLIFK